MKRSGGRREKTRLLTAAAARGTDRTPLRRWDGGSRRRQPRRQAARRPAGVSPPFPPFAIGAVLAVRFPAAGPPPPGGTPFSPFADGGSSSTLRLFPLSWAEQVLHAPPLLSLADLAPSLRGGPGGMHPGARAAAQSRPCRHLREGAPVRTAKLRLRWTSASVPRRAALLAVHFSPPGWFFAGSPALQRRVRGADRQAFATLFVRQGQPAGTPLETVMAEAASRVSIPSSSGQAQPVFACQLEGCEAIIVSIPSSSGQAQPARRSTAWQRCVRTCRFNPLFVGASSAGWHKPSGLG